MKLHGNMGIKYLFLRERLERLRDRYSLFSKVKTISQLERVCELPKPTSHQVYQILLIEDLARMRITRQEYENWLMENGRLNESPFQVTASHR